MKDDIDAILAQYADAAASPGGARLEEWIRRYPQHADAITHFAVNDYVLEHGAAYDSDEVGLAGAFVRRAEAVRLRMMEDRASYSMVCESAPITSLLAEAKKAGIAPPALAERLRLGLVMLTKLERRVFRPASLPGALIDRVAEAIGRTRAEVAAYFALPSTLSGAASYKASAAPRATEQEEFLAALRQSPDVSDEQRAYWESRADGGV